MAPTKSSASGQGVVKPMQVMSLGMTRTGSASITQALTILGYRSVHHGIQAISNPNDWAVFSSASDALFTALPSYNGKPFGRSDWDKVFGQCEAVTDMGSFFALPLIEAYPDAKIVLVERDVDSWYESMEEAVFSTTWGWRANLIIDVFGRLMNLTGGLTIRKIMLGYYEARNVTEMRANAKMRYHRHYAEIRAAVPEEQLLNYDLKQGWGPLCEFLGKPVPDMPFPQANKRKEHVARVRAKQNMFLKAMCKKTLRALVPLILSSGAVGLAVWSWGHQNAVSDGLKRARVLLTEPLVAQMVTKH
ncbi:hypothetical protein PG993_002936 [Apiospora rasikravindrae]|uniref:P-loop containing nucleoside triphosphate hydrolase protein n=1 Tax=Apiospora rasikravindrae TaxID=990691 RepID=A0ABR1TY36_9PEZI